MSLGKVENIKQFEEILDKELMDLPVLACNGESVIATVLRLIETLDQKGTQRAYALRKGLNILAPYLIGMKSDAICEPKQLIQNLLFAYHYYHIRELLYYSYNTDNSIEWSFKNKTVTIRYQDVSIPRQFFLTANNFFLGSLENFSRGDDYNKIINLLKGEDEFSNSDNIQQACRLITVEVQKKFEVYYNFVEGEENLDLGLFTYREFKKVYGALLTKALYHRYYVWANQTEGGTIHLPIDDLINDLSTDMEVSPGVCRTIIETISYSCNAKKRKLDPTYYSLFYLEDAQIIVMSPNDFAMWPGFSNIYRIVSYINPKQYQSEIGRTLSRNFVNYIVQAFSQQGFKCFKDVDLSKFDSGLPDIDVVAVSEEATLGYFLFFCEVKNPIPPMWAKDQLRVLHKDSIVKAFGQLEKITDFLNTEEGVFFTRDHLLPKQGHPYLGEQFVIAGHSLIVTSNNAGMFFGREKVTVIDYVTLERILKRSDGDVTYIIHMLKSLAQQMDKCYKKAKIRCNVGKLKVIYEGVELKKVMDLPQHSYKSDKSYEVAVKEYFQQGLHPFDMFEKDSVRKARSK